SERPSCRSLDSRFKYIRSEGRNEGEEGIDLGELTGRLNVRGGHAHSRIGCEESIQGTDN
ncbi:hypothetical protein JG688_00009652, partial [Phytophthora aleatoria]